MSLLNGQIALVTGASRGIGAAIARHFAALGATVAVNYKSNAEAAQQTVDAISVAGGSAHAFQADVSDEAQVRALIAAVLKLHGRIDTLVVNAGIVRDHLAALMPVADFDHVLQVNLRGAFLSIREVIPAMMEARSGNILTISSVNAETGGRGQCNYAASKAGLLAITRSLAIELAPKNIRVNALAPGLIETDMTQPVRDLAHDELLRRIPMKRFGTSQEVAQAAAFLVSPMASYITGAVLNVSGGLGLQP
jgi:3-oxoacyl-[acyl-carrier protein] reductase